MYVCVNSCMYVFSELRTDPRASYMLSPCFTLAYTLSGPTMFTSKINLKLRSIYSVLLETSNILFMFTYGTVCVLGLAFQNWGFLEKQNG